MKSRRNRRPRAALAWGLAAFAFYLAAATFGLEVFHPESYDPEYAARLGILKARMSEAPRKPPLIVSGSSRVAMGFRPECLPPLVDAGGSEVLPFNFSQFGSGPVMNLMRLRRLLDDGVRPAWLVVELMPQYLREEKPHFLMQAAGARDYPTLASYFPAWKFLLHYARRRLKQVPSYPQRWLFPLPESGRDYADERSFTSLGSFVHVLGSVEPEVRERKFAGVRGVMLQPLALPGVSPGADRATRDLLSLCHAEGIAVVLLLTPESDRFRTLYGPGSSTWLAEYASALAREHGIAVIDASRWLQEEETEDGHHPLLGGAEKFTRLLGRDLQSLLTPAESGNPSPPSGASP